MKRELTNTNTGSIMPDQHGGRQRQAMGGGGAQLRRRVAEEVDKVAGRKVVEVNINVVGIHLEEAEPKKETPEPRVQ